MNEHMPTNESTAGVEAPASQPAENDSAGESDPTPDEAAPDPSAAETGDDTVGQPVPDEQETDWEALAEADVRSRAELLAELTEAEARRDEYLEDVRRARAEFDNFRKRMMREGVTQREHGQAEVMSRLLDVLDDFDRTVDAIVAFGDEKMVEGVALVRDKLVLALSDLGLSRIDAVGTAFDPNLHEAVQQRPAEDAAAQPTVVEVFRPGYRIGDRVLRPAMVVVEQ